MAKNKYYAVKKGNVCGIFESWEDCQKSISGFSSPEHKGFRTLEEAQAYLNDENIYWKQIEEDISNGYVVAYTDGSFNQSTNEYSYGICIFDLDKNETNLCSKLSHAAFVESRNIAGEIFGVITALDWAVSNGHEKIKIYHDLEGVSKWALGEYSANSDIAKYYKKVLAERFDTCIEYEFVKVPGHSNNPYNEKADKLANSALAGERKLIEGANSFVVPNFSADDLEAVIALIKEELPEIKEDRKDILGGKQIKLGTGKKNSVTIKIYNSNKLLVQSKPNAIYQIVLTNISELLGEKNVLKLVKEAYRIKINRDTLDTNYAIFCTNIPANYNNNIKTLLRQAIINLNGYFEAEEYGQYAYPALRALEGHIKYLFNKNGIHVEKTFSQFNGNEVDGYILTTPLKEPDKTNIENCYNYYVKTRHKIFHFGDILGCTDNTYLIDTKQKADEIIREAIRLINNSAY